MMRRIFIFLCGLVFFPGSSICETAGFFPPKKIGYKEEKVILKKTERKNTILRNPGEITFTVGSVIEAQIEKPQVMIVFPKAKAKKDLIIFDHSFTEKILEPLFIETVKGVETP